MSRHSSTYERRKNSTMQNNGDHQTDFQEQNRYNTDYDRLRGRENDIRQNTSYPQDEWQQQQQNYQSTPYQNYQNQNRGYAGEFRDNYNYENTYPNRQFQQPQQQGYENYQNQQYDNPYRNEYAYRGSTPFRNEPTWQPNTPRRTWHDPYSNWHADHEGSLRENQNFASPTRSTYQDFDRNQGYATNWRQQQGVGYDTNWNSGSSEYGIDRGRYETNTSRYRGQYSGMGPKGYQRSDERIKEDISDRLTDDGILNATDIELEVNKGEVVLKGSVDNRESKRHAENIAESVSGVSNVENRLKVNNTDTYTENENKSNSNSSEKSKSRSI